MAVTCLSCLAWLSISVPLVMWGSSLLLSLVERFPDIVCLGACVLAGAAAKMITSLPIIADAFTAYRFTVPLTFVVVVFGVDSTRFTGNGSRQACPRDQAGSLIACCTAPSRG